jgi:hypothetical protein
MKLLASVSVIVLATTIANHAFADQAPDQCSGISASIQSTVDAITAKDNKLTADQQAAIQARASQIEDDANKDKPDNAAEAAIKFKIDVSSHLQKFSLDLPAVTIRNQDIIFDMPETELKQQVWKYNIPQTRMKMQCINKPPETVCHNELKDFGLFKTDVPVCSLRAGGQMCTQIPEVFMAETSTQLGVPEVTMRQQKITMGIPEFKMERQDFSFTVPDFTLRNIEADMQVTQKESDELNQTAQDGSNALAGGMKSEITKASTDASTAVLGCEKDGINNQRNQALAEIDKNISVVQAALQQAQTVGAATLVASMQDALTKLVTAKNAMNSQFDAAIAGMVVKPTVQ